MPSSAAELVELLDIETLDTDLFRGRSPDTDRQRVFGGQVAAQALIAAIRTVGAEGLDVHSMHAYFLRPGDTTIPIIYDAERIRDGRSFETRRVVARQHGRPIFYLTANFQRPEEGFDHQDAMPEVPGPDERAHLRPDRRSAPAGDDEVGRRLRQGVGRPRHPLPRQLRRTPGTPTWPRTATARRAPRSGSGSTATSATTPTCTSRRSPTPAT